ncbi:hypothetical protein MMC31_008130, partial [Peltigera leucophlebia]|nr:hypothetical protein [Peltigera leucophlebia]
MSPVYFFCIICGQTISDDRGSSQASWQSQFRKVYSDSGAISISGVGIHENPRGGSWVAPLNESMRWNDWNYHPQASDEVPVMRQPSFDGRHGVVLHDACWCLLKAALDPQSVPLERLFNVCESLPFPLYWDGVCWEHDYGGLALLDEQGHYPWEDRLSEVTYSEVHLNAEANPYDVPDIVQLIVMPLGCPPNPTPSRYHADCFTLLPWEILEAIAVNLPTYDALNLRLASRSFARILTSQTFWASRFAPGGERDFVFEMRKGKKGKDWRHLYRHTSYSRLSLGLLNRMRIWHLIRFIEKHLRLSLDDKLGGLSQEMNSTDLQWHRVRGDVRQELGAGLCTGFNEGCRVFGKSRAFIPNGLSRIAFSIIQSGKADYVVGMRLVSVGEEDRQLGYKGNEVFFEVTALRGFAVAVGPRGIRAIQVICDDGTRSPWFGCPKSSPLTERLVRTKCIVALEVEFDGYKLVSLSVAEATRPHEDMSEAQKPSLRNDALWYPSVPGVDLCLNERSFTGEPPSATGYRPLAWILFGGPNGDWLRHLAQVSVRCEGNLYDIEFHYDIDWLAGTEVKLGRRHLASNPEPLRFNVDGRGGVIITALATNSERIDQKGVWSFYKHGKLSSFE